MNKTALVIIVLVVIIGGYLLLRSSYEAPQPNGQSQSAVPAPGQENVPEAIVAPDDTEEPLPTDEKSELSVREINLTSGSLFFNPDNLTLTKDQPVKINIQNSGSHTFTIDQLGVDVRLQGSQEVVEFTPSQSGTFEYYCAVPGHWEGGMFGTLIVE